MSSEITKRLAVSNLNREKVPIQWLFKIIETLLEKKIVSIRTYLSKKNTAFSVVEFFDSDDAKKLYDFCDGLQIEDTKEVFDLSFIPESMEFEDPLDECLDGSTFRFKKNVRQQIDYNNLVEVSDEEDRLGIDIPEHLKQIAVHATEEKKISPKEKEIAEMKKALEKDDEVDEYDGFQFDVKDGRFQQVFTNDDFAIDASNKKFKKQPETIEILNEIRKKYENSK